MDYKTERTIAILDKALDIACAEIYALRRVAGRPVESLETRPRIIEEACLELPDGDAVSDHLQSAYLDLIKETQG